MRRFRTKGRSTKTYNNKLRKLKSLYERMYKNSKKTKEKTKEPNTYFCDKYKDFESYRKTVVIKEPNQHMKG